MANLSQIAKQARITAYKSGLTAKLAARIIDTAKSEFADLYADGNPAKKMTSLNGDIILERHIENGVLKGVVSVHPDALASMLPDLKADTTDKTGWKKHLDKFNAEGNNILIGVVDPVASEYELSAVEQLAALDIPPMSDAAGKAKLVDLQVKVKAEKGI